MTEPARPTLTAKGCCVPVCGELCPGEGTPALGSVPRLGPSGSNSSDDIAAWLFTAAVRPHQGVKRRAPHPPELGSSPPRAASLCCTLKRKRYELKSEFRPEDLCDLLIYYIPKHHRKCEFSWEEASSSFQRTCRHFGRWGLGLPRGSHTTLRGSGAAGQHSALDRGQLHGPEDTVGPAPKGFTLCPQVHR